MKLMNQLGLSSDIFPSGLQIKFLYNLFISPMGPAGATHLVLLDLITMESKKQRVPSL